MIKKSLLLVLSLLFALAASAAGPDASDYPSKPIRLVIPYPPGGSADLVGRMVADKLGKSLGQTVVVDNKGGGSGSIGSDFVSRAPADGYTLLVAISDTHAINPAVMANLPYDPQKDFAPISLLATQPMVLAVGRHMPARTLADFVAEAKKRPGALTYASNGKGGLQHLAMELFSRQAGIKALHVPYKGAGPALADVIGGQVDALFISLQGAGGNLGTGNLRALAVAAPKRLSMAADVPTFAESGYPDTVVTQWYGLMAPAGTPPAIVQKLNSEVRKALDTPDISDKLKAVGTEPAGDTPQEFAAFLAAQIKLWAGVAKSVGARLE
ncbi:MULTISPECIES: Bug family tripartite tricarboxylate transporter substrate binding protein [unclassified Variovorax]|uniref:Bug family tripartite tricarboxylate transporter substrate binding protein n=1 Tax=unclassified Variovorax TaxID=663243 RepID=UPI0013191078|nr:MULTISPECIES: tripartite tricarboxylate transporter substrate binding protein [unclassified Variovorax]VTU45720.1 Argininosuccinate lyase [Variovorax sp. PBL-E5]VTU46605.1 Argininosuccinate lyase [Variovorax sp. SRS16]